jgi:hypothetical protein
MSLQSKHYWKWTHTKRQVCTLCSHVIQYLASFVSVHDGEINSDLTFFPSEAVHLDFIWMKTWKHKITDTWAQEIRTLYIKFTPLHSESWLFKLRKDEVIPLKAWISLCIYSVFMLSCVGRGLASGWSPVQGIPPAVCKIHRFRINSEWRQAREPVFTRNTSMCDYFNVFPLQF